MAAYIGTSGFGYAEWKGNFYPAKFPGRSMLHYYAQRLPSVELNNTFYRLPRTLVLQGWRQAVPDSFRFAVKAPQAFTHRAKLRMGQEPLVQFVELLAPLEGTLGPILFQLPPTLRADTALLRDFMQQLPQGTLAAFEFRHGSWFVDEILGVLEAAGCALVGGDVDDPTRTPPLERTADFAYVRLRKAEYGPGELEEWALRLEDLGVSDVHVYFKHEVVAPQRALRLLELLTTAEGSAS